jgi:hypothetical protein
MSWILPKVPPEIKALNSKEAKKRRDRQWEIDNREKRNKYWRKLRSKDGRWRAYLNEWRRKRRENRNGL